MSSVVPLLAGLATLNVPPSASIRSLSPTSPDPWAGSAPPTPALGIADSVGAAGRTGKVKIIGLDGIAEALDAIQAGSISATVSQYPYVMGQVAVEACAVATRGARLPTRVDAPIALLTKSNVARAIAAFPMPVQRYSDPFTRLLR